MVMYMDWEIDVRHAFTVLTKQFTVGRLLKTALLSQLLNLRLYREFHGIHRRLVKRAQIWCQKWHGYDQKHVGDFYCRGHHASL